MLVTIRLSSTTVIATLLLALAMAGLVACTITWFLLMDRIGQAPARPTAEHTAPYSRHGQTAYLTRRDAQLLEWLPAAGLPLGFGVFALGLWARYSWIKDMHGK